MTNKKETEKENFYVDGYYYDPYSFPTDYFYDNPYSMIWNIPTRYSNDYQSLHNYIHYSPYLYYV
uniref:Uncharacterized protein n=1 Tax=viral metagenome TaxID=1070528 RepID=A0A6C0EAP3_9ZZZZ